jgi:glutathione peroxidase
MTKHLYDFTVDRLDGSPASIGDHAGKVLLIVNTASKCGLTPHYKGLEALYQELGERGLVVLGFPCNQFAMQEPGGAEAIQSFCELNYGVTFPLHTKIKVNGPGTHPLYQHLKQAAPGMLGSKAIKWNFTKFLVSRDGTVLKRYAPKTLPEDMRDDIIAELEKS